MDPAGLGSHSESVLQSVQMKAAADLLETMVEKCFKKCITKPGASLDSSERKCILYCADRYMDTTKIVNQTIMDRVRQHTGRY